MSAETNKDGGGEVRKKMWVKIRKVTDEEKKLERTREEERVGREKTKMKNEWICVAKRGNESSF